MRLKIFVAMALLLSVVLVACEPEVVEVEVEVTREVETVVTQEVVVEQEVTREVEIVVEEVVETVVEVETTVEILALPAVDPLAVDGDIVIAGSSTVFPLAERMIEVFEDEGYGGNLTYDSIGSGGGFERFCVNGETDISGASRAIKDSEVESCAAIGRNPIEFRVGTDALAVVVSAENEFLSDLSAEQLAAAFSTAETWADVDPSFPAEAILRYIPGTDSGTFDYFVEEVFEEDSAPILAAANTELSEDDNVLVQGITGSPNAIGFFGYAYYQENADSLNILSIDGIEANQENVDAAAYPLARPLFIYSDAGIMAEKPQVADFISYFLSNVNDQIGNVGYFPAGVADLNGAKQAWADAASVALDMGDDMMMDSLLSPVDPLEVSGDIVIAGSSTVFPLAERMIEVFEDEGYSDNLTYDSIGSGGGFERFCVNGETDISGASRAIKDSEVESCAAIGRNPIEFRIGTDALAVVVSAENDFVSDLSAEQLAAAFSTAETWADVDPSFPAEAILRYIPGTDSGTFDYFVEEVFDEDSAPILAASNTELSEDDNVLVQGIQGSPNAIGFFGYAYYQENADSLNILSIDGVEAVKENVDAATYPLARPLFMYSDASIIAEKPQVGEFLSYVLQNVNNEIGAVGYFPAADSVLAGAEEALAGALHGGDDMMMDDMMMGLDAVDPLEVTGDIVIAGSSTVFPLAERMIEVFEDEGYGGNLTYDSIGSGGGFERFCVNGETDISGASRAIKDSEVESCAAIGRNPIEFRIGTDALAVVVSAENDFVSDLSAEQLAAAFSTAETWADVDPSFPAEAILRYIPGTDSGTFDYFVEEVFDEDSAPILAASNTELSEDDNVLVQGIQGSPNAIGFFGYAYYQENADSLNILSIDGVEAVKENVDAATYPLARPLFMYSDASIIAEKPQVGQFLSYVLQNVNNEIGAVGYFPAADDVLGGAADALGAAISGEDMMMAEPTIVDIAVGDGNFTTLVAALDAAGLVETLSGEGPFTVFAPTDDAFAALPEGTVEALLEDPSGALTDILLYHVVSGEVLAETVVTLDSATTILGADVSIAVVDGGVVLNDSVNVVITDIVGSNGVIHVIDAVLLPPAGDSSSLPAVDPLAVSGDIVIAGSSTVFPLAERMIEVFEDEGYGDNLTYDSIGSGGGFERFCVNGETDISGASRAIKDSEIESCEAIGRSPIEFRVGTDALAVVVSAENAFLSDLSAEQLAAAFSTAETWADVDPSFPAETILRYIPGTDSGTFDYFVEEVFEEDSAPILAASNTELSEDDNVLVQGILGSPNAIGFFGYAYYQENADALTILSIDGVEANQENVDAAAYPLARPLFIYSDASIIAEKPQVGEFINFFLTNVNNEIGAVGYFPAGAADLDGAKSALADALGQ